MMKFEVGKKLDMAVGIEDGLHFSMDASGALLIVHMRHPDAKEVSSFSQGETLRMGIFHRRGQMIMLFRFGDMPWMDAPYDPHIGTPPVLPETINDGMSIAFQIVLADTADGTIKALRLVSPPTRFARHLVDTIREIQQQPFDKHKYQRDLYELMTMYPTRVMVDEISAICKVV